MQAKINKVGRPCNGNKDVRKELIKYARHLFTIMPYEKVSTRLISSKAGVSSSLIRYYFGDKEGLFEIVIGEITEPFYAQLNKLLENTNFESFKDLLRVFLSEIKRNPQLPKLLSRFMSLPESDRQRKLIEQTLTSYNTMFYGEVLNKMTENGLLNKNINPVFFRLSLMSLMVHPFIIPKSLLSVHGVELNDVFFEQFLEHNIEPMTHGVMQV